VTAERTFSLLRWQHAAYTLAGLLAFWAGFWLLSVLTQGHLPAGFFLAMAPVLALTLAAQYWGLGGRLVIEVQPGLVRARRDRWPVRGKVIEVRGAAGDRPAFVVERLTLKRFYPQGQLFVELGGKRTPLVSYAEYRPLAEIAAELNAAR
jgi:hypothetical protein